MRLSTVMAVLLIGALLYFVMAVIRAVVIGRMPGMQDGVRRCSAPWCCWLRG